METENFLTKANLDWTEKNQKGLYQCLCAAYNLTEELISPLQHAAFGTPNQRHLRGVSRWVFVDYSLEEGCKRGLITDIYPEWAPLGGSEYGVHVLELKGKHSCLSAHHLSAPDIAPRDSTKRREKRILNQIQPTFDFPEFKEPTDESLLQILLVHGHQNLNFVYLRAYTNPNMANSFIRLSENLTTLYGGDVVEEEQVREVEIGVKESLQKQNYKKFQK